MTQPSARERILDVARRLFYRDGLRATGIDRIVAESGVAKMSLYRHFPSKNDLIGAFLDWRHEHWMTWFTGAVEARLAHTPELAVLADALGEWFAQDDFRGCAFINAVAETGAGDEPRHLAQAFAHKQALEAYIADVAARLGLAGREAVAQEAMLCVEGMIVRAQFRPDPAIVQAGRRLLARIEHDARPARRRRETTHAA
ncbi:TetR/AcrR family transcriptional regulator [uncultured Massilia sp.]|uniref:TetR/AcrR family transcriptional regulator n=1 Tax=uncultured Massilia sp. TaxID=169973 RepID=UPI0025CD1460|nr:TetR/AcrR family transcriptional regulator [uncultured Massilia sp.]